MIGISKMGCYIPETKESNYAVLEKFGVDENFIKEKLGVEFRARKNPAEMASDLCVKAYAALQQAQGLSVDEIGCCVVVTQNPDYNIPHVSAIVHGHLGLPEDCASFDISLGCSGYVYALSIVRAFMKDNAIAKGLLFTADPYSDIIDSEDKNTAMLFGDAATVTLLETGASLQPIAFDFGSKGSEYKSIFSDGKLHMNGRAVFNFTASKIPLSIDKLLLKAKLEKVDIKKWFFHQGSKYIVDTITSRLHINAEDVIFDMYRYGNTVSSSIPILLSQELGHLKAGDKIVLCGFGVGLSWAATVLEKN
jgi:3-oxoacyl-[acyl-carrier-protein] synthase-3